MPIIQDTIEAILSEQWAPRTGTVVPQIDAVNLSNDIVAIEGSVIFADLAHSTRLVRDHSPQFASQVIKIFLAVCSRAIRTYNGEIRSFDGDRVMGVFTGLWCAENASRAALLLNSTMRSQAIPRITQHWNIHSGYTIGYGCGADVGLLHVVRAGIRSYNDLVFLGMTTINAAKLAQERVTGFPILITSRMYERIKYGNLARNELQKPLWTAMYSPQINEPVYGAD